MISRIIPSLSFPGTCIEALTFYQDVFQAELIEKITYEQTEMADTKEQNSLIMSASFALGNVLFSASDIPDDEPLSGDQISFWLDIDTEKDFNTCCERFKEKQCLFITPLQTTFWNALYVKVQDPFGICWELSFQKNTNN